jgi:hypothetical protein
MKHPIALAAKAAYVELTTVEAKSFFKSTAVEHSLLTMFYFLEAVYWTIEAGRITRGFVDSFSVPEESTTTIAGLLCPAQDIPPITTEAVVVQSNQQKLEQHITQTLREIQDHVKSNQESDEVGDEPVGEAIVGMGEESVPDQINTYQAQPVPTRKQKPRASSGNRVQAENPAPKSRVSHKKRGVQEE